MPVTTVNAPLPGIFYMRPSPSDPAFKQPGDAVAAGDTLGLIEVMKSFMPVESTVAGRFVRYLAESEEGVDADQPICEIEA